MVEYQHRSANLQLRGVGREAGNPVDGAIGFHIMLILFMSHFAQDFRIGYQSTLLYDEQSDRYLEN